MSDQKHQQELLKRYNEKLQQLQKEITRVAPHAEEGQLHLFHEVCRSVQSAKAAREAAERVRDHTSDPEAKKKAEEALQAADHVLNESIALAVKTASPLLDSIGNFLQSDNYDHWFLTCAILKEATPSHLANFAARGKEFETRVEEFLADLKLQRDFLEAGGATGGQYPEAVEIYQNITKEMEDKTNPVLQKLAIGVAAELASPKGEFETPEILIDPVKRYKHYEQAYLHEELDPAFPNFSTFHYRYATNCDAPDEQLGWAREMLRNYRPDLAVLGDQHWRYTFLVRSEMGYNRPEFLVPPRTYAQLICGGGQCGPRAWVGRFISQAFGIPIWGVRQPGHAALSRWTPAGWAICLGAGWQFSYWQGRCGTDFFLETQAREHGGNHYITVDRLEWVANGFNEPKLDASKGIVHPDLFWRSLALCQKYRLAAKSGEDAVTRVNSQVHPAVFTLAEREMQIHRDNGKAAIQNDGTIVVPATTCCPPKPGTSFATFQISYLGGKQLYLKDGGTIEYVVDDIPKNKTYKLSLRIVNVHSHQQPLLISVSSTADAQEPVTVVSVSIPYTVGVWQWTEPVEVELAKGTNHVILSREAPSKGLGFKDMTFTPCDFS